MYQALYRAYRPEVFSEVLGQEHIVKILRNQIATDSTSHAYLFCGTRGTGKTTTARLLAKGLNCLSDGDKPCGTCANCQAIKEGRFIDVIEIDAASNNGVDNIRELRENVNYPPALGRKKIYIIDEVHMLSSGAFNALLKTLEEPPEYVTFILATTEVQKLPATILSRCMRLDFKRVPENTLINGMGEICNKIGIDVSEDALRVIAANADGSVRDGLSILDQCISGGEKVVGAKDVLEFLGASGDEDFIELTDMVIKKRTADAIEYLADILSDGKDVRQFMKDWINHYRNLLMIKFIKDPQNVVNMSSENIERVKRQSNSIELEDINNGIIELSRTLNEAKWSTQPRILLELAIVKLCNGVGELKMTAGIKRIAQEETEDAEGSVMDPEPEFQPVTEDLAHESVSTSDDLSDVDYDKLWSDLFEAGELRQGSLFLVFSSGKLTGMNDNEFFVSGLEGINKEYAEKNRNLLEKLMAQLTGQHRVMRLVDEKEKEKTVNEIVSAIESVIHAPVEIE